ncbi:MAG: sigma-70 family RNA polymerase sigma factor [Pseudomonadota bacterium]
MSESVPSELKSQTSNEEAESSESPTNVRQLEGQKSILSKLYARYFKQLVAGLRATYGSGPPDPDDIAQRAFAKLSAHARFGEIEDLEGYVWITARNLMLTEIRSMGVRSRHARQELQDASGDQCDEFDPERVLIAREELEIVMRVLEDMPERRRNIFLAKRVDGLSAKAAGRKYGVSRSSAVRHIAIATTEISIALGRIGTNDGSGRQ